MASLQQQPGQDILLSGSATLMHTLMDHGFVDEYRLWLHPVMAGGGQRLFRGSEEMTLLQRTAITPFSSGVTICTTSRPAHRTKADRCASRRERRFWMTPPGREPRSFKNRDT